MIEIRLLQAAITVEEERNITRAADRPGLTQPALSKQLAELEEETGFVLFKRNSQRFEVTEAGAAFVEHTRIALAEIDRAVHAGRAALAGTDSVLQIAKSPYVDPYFASIMRSLQLPLYPNLELTFSSHFSNEALRALRTGEADLALISALDDPKGVTSMRLAEEQFYFAMPAEDSLCSKRSVELFDLDQRRLVLFQRDANPVVYSRLRQILAEDGIQPVEIQHVHQAEEAAALVIQRGSVALLNKTGAWRISDGSITVRPLADRRLILKTYLSARLSERSRVVAEFTKAVHRRLFGPKQQSNLAKAG